MASHKGSNLHPKTSVLAAHMSSVPNLGLNAHLHVVNFAVLLVISSSLIDAH